MNQSSPSLPHRALRRGLLLVAFSTLLVALSSAPSAAQAGEEVARLESVEGIVEAQPAGASKFEPVQAGAVFRANDFIHTTAQGRAAVRFVDGGLLRLAENTTLQFRPAAQGEPSNALQVSSGRGFFFSREPANHPIVKTSAVSAAIRGTEFVFDVTATKTVVTVLDGAVECYNAQGSVVATNGEQAETIVGQAPVKRIIVNPRDAAQWALYYPSVLDVSELAELGIGASPKHERGFEALSRGELDAAMASFDGRTWRDALGRAVVLDSRGQRGKALAELEGVKGEASATFDLYKASLLLSLGQVQKAEEASAGIAKKIEAAPEGARASLRAAHRAQKAVIAVVNDRKEESRTLAAEAVEASSTSASASIASAYVAQAHFDLDEARRQLLRAIELAPRSALPKARLAEIELGFGEVREAERRVNEALAISPNDAYALSVLGFIRLMDNEIEEAKEAFDRAIAADGAMALPRLGRGLAIIRQGDVAGGREELEAAAALEPNVSLYRSYLGKAFFEEEREGLAAREYDIAVELDPRDPTPHLYRAYNHLSNNRPVDALRDVERSIELNDDRAIYRSRLLLDQDAAVRSAGLAEVFNSMGFSEIARIEAIKSINRDYGNHSAHLLLADSYKSFFLSDAAVSERRIAEILAPPSFNLFNNPPGGEASLNEYNALFDRDDDRTEISYLGQTNQDLSSPRVGHSGKREDVAYFASYEGAYALGSKDNNYFTQTRATAGAVYQPDLENRFLGRASGTFFHRDLHFVGEDVERDIWEADLGYHRRLTPQARLVTQVALGKQYNDFRTDFAEWPIDVIEVAGGEELLIEDSIIANEETREKVGFVRGTIQHIFDSAILSSVTGVQALFSNPERDDEATVIDDAAAFFPGIDYRVRSHSNEGLNSQDYYSYNTLHLADWVDLHLGAAYSNVEIEDAETVPFIDQTHHRSKLSPKLGLTFYPTGDTTIRAAYFEGLRKSSLEDNFSLEPTLVSGINQRFTDDSGARSASYGFGVDHKLAGSTYLGVEGIRRRLNGSFHPTLSTAELDFDSMSQSQDVLALDSGADLMDQSIGKAYLYHVLTKNLVATADYQYTLFERDLEDTGDFDEIENHRVALALRHFHRSGIFSFGRATWRDQRFDGGLPFEGSEAQGSHELWLVDLGVGYRLPNRHGSIALEVTNLLDEDFVFPRQEVEGVALFSDIGVRLVASYNF